MKTAPQAAAPCVWVLRQPRVAGGNRTQLTNEIGPTLMKVGYEGGVLFVRLT